MYPLDIMEVLLLIVLSMWDLHSSRVASRSHINALSNVSIKSIMILISQTPRTIITDAGGAFLDIIKVIFL